MIMTTSEHFHAIADSLADAAENHWNAFHALGTPESAVDGAEAEVARELALSYERLHDAWEAGVPLDDEDDVELAIDALRASEAVARELAEGMPVATHERTMLYLAADDYEAARLHLEG